MRCCPMMNPGLAVSQYLDVMGSIERVLNPLVTLGWVCTNIHTSGEAVHLGTPYDTRTYYPFTFTSMSRVKD